MKKPFLLLRFPAKQKRTVGIAVCLLVLLLLGGVLRSARTDAQAIPVSTGGEFAPQSLFGTFVKALGA